MSKHRSRQPHLPRASRPQGSKSVRVIDPTGETVGLVKDALAAGEASVRAVQASNAKMVTALVNQCAAKENINPATHGFDLASLKWVPLHLLQAPKPGV